MVDYAGNSKASKEGPAAVPEAKKIVSGAVSTKKRPLSGKFREVFLGADAKGLFNYVVTEVLIPSARNMFFDSVVKGAGRMTYGERGAQPGMGAGMFGGMKTPYSQASTGAFKGVVPSSPNQRAFQQPGLPQTTTENFVLSSREDAELVIDSMNEHIQMQGAVTMYALKTMLGLIPAHTDYKWGWTSLRGAQMKQQRDGYVMELPNPVVL